MERKTPRFKKSHVNYSELLHLARAGVIFVSWSFETALIFGAYHETYQIQDHNGILVGTNDEGENVSLNREQFVSMVYGK